MMKSNESRKTTEIAEVQVLEEDPLENCEATEEEMEQCRALCDRERYHLVGGQWKK